LDPTFDLICVYVDPPTAAPKLPCLWSKRRVEEFGSNQDHDPTVVAFTDCGEPVTASLFIFLHCMAEDAPFAA